MIIFSLCANISTTLLMIRNQILFTIISETAIGLDQIMVTSKGIGKFEFYNLFEFHIFSHT